MDPLIFLIVLAGIWLVFASVYDLKKRMVPNWLSFSLVIFGLSFRFFYSLFNNDFVFFYQGLIGLGIFFIIGNALYYGRLFAGGDAKLMISLGPILGFSLSFFENLELYALFVVLFLFLGGFYGLIWSFYLSLSNFKVFKKEFINQYNKNKEVFYSVMALALFIMIFGFFESLIFYFGIILFIMPYLYLYSRAIDNSCLVKNLSVSKLEEGDWVYRNLKVGKRIIKPNWEGLNKSQIKEIQKHYKKVKIRQGIPFVPTFFN